MKTFINIAKILLQFFPLTVFVRVAFLDGAPQAGDWLLAFIWGGGAAVVQLALFGIFARAWPLNRIILGVNVYLILGGGAVLSSQMVLLEAFDNMKESGIFLCLILVGLITTFASKAGFIGVVDVVDGSGGSGGSDGVDADGTSRACTIRRYSLVLLGLTCAGLIASFAFRGQTLFSAAVPLIVLSVTMRLCQRRLRRGA